MGRRYDAADRLFSAGATTFAYDADGNRISQTNGSTVWAYSYDAANRLSSVIGTGVNNTNSYDGDGNRIAQNTALGSYSYVNDTASALPVVLNEQGPDGNITFAYGTNLIEEASSSFNYFYGFDGLGSVASLTDGVTGKAVTAYAYDPWGNATSNGSVGLKDKFRFTGEALDPGTGLYYLRARYYDPTIGRFTQKDPSKPTGNGYTYSYNRPTVMYDPTGLSGELAIYSYSTGSDYGILGGHSWIGYQPNGGTTTTYGTWGNNPDSLGNGLHEDIELNIPCTLQDGCASRVTYLDDAQQAQLYAVVQQYQQEGSAAWSLLSPCSTFAAAAWGAATGEYLNPDLGWYLSDPLALRASIILTNGGQMSGTLSPPPTTQSGSAK